MSKFKFVDALLELKIFQQWNERLLLGALSNKSSFYGTPAEVLKLCKL